MVLEDRRHFSRETSTSRDRTMPTQSSRSANADEEPTKIRNGQNTELLAISLAVLLLFLIVVLITVSLLVLFVYWRYNKRRAGSKRRWPTQKSLLSFGDNDDSVSRVMSTASAAAGCAKLDAPSELRCRCQVRRSTSIFHLSGVYTIIHVRRIHARRTCRPTPYMYDSVNTALV